MNRTLFVLAILLLALVALLGGPLAPEAKAAFPGANGKIVFYSRGDIYTISKDGAGQTRLTYHPDVDLYPAWSPDGTMIAFTRYGYDHWGIYVMDAYGNGEVRLTNNDDGYDGVNGQPAWSPDGTKIAFVSNHQGNSEIYVMNSDGSGQTRLTNHELMDSAPAWSPDGAKIAFTSDRYDGNNTNIYVMNADGSQPTRLTSTVGFSPAWSPDGTKIVFAGVPNENNLEIFVMNADGSGQTRLTYSEGADDEPAWSADGTKLVFASTRTGRGEIFVMKADGAEQTRLTRKLSSKSQPDWQPILPGRFFFYPTNDAHVLSSYPNTVYNWRRLQIKDAAADMNAYIKFNVTGLTGTVQSATLRLWVLDPGPDGGKVYATSPYYRGTTNLWLETGLKWSNAPAISGAPLDSAGKVDMGRWVELDVTAAVAAATAGGNGRVSFALTNDSLNQVAYSSKEGGHAPDLEVVTR